MKANGQILAIQPGGIKAPARLDIFKHGPKLIYLSIHADQTHLALVGSPDAMAAELRRAADQIEVAAATNDQGYISREEIPIGAQQLISQPAPPAPPERKPVMADLNGDPKHDWPLFVRRFHGNKETAFILPAIANHYKKTYLYSPPDIDTVLDVSERIELDFETIRPYLADMLAPDGSFKRGARARVAEALGIKDKGNYRPKIDAMLDFISNAVSNGDLAELLGSWVAKSNDSNAVLERRVAG